MLSLGLERAFDACLRRSSTQRDLSARRCPHAYAHARIALAACCRRFWVVAVRCRQAQQPAQPPAAAAAASSHRRPPPRRQPGSRRQAAAASQQPIRTGINFVRVDVIVTDKEGKPVLDLKPDDFAVAEDGKPQKVDTFSVVKIDALADRTGRRAPIRSDSDEEREAARPDVRLFVILLDDYHVRRGNDMSVRKPLIDFVQNQLAPADMVALMYPLTPVTDLRFTRNREGTDHRHRPVRGPQVRLPAAQRVRGEVRLLPGADASSGSATRSRWARSRARR